MYFRLHKDYALRGWEKMNAVLLKRPQNHRAVLTQEEFSLLLLCDGTTDFSEIPFSDSQSLILDRLVKKGIVEELTIPAAISEDQRYCLYPNRFVESCFWSITGRCNFRCRHCYMDAPSGSLGELSHEEALELIDQMADCGILHVDITGGEPFVRKDFWQLIDKIQSHKMTIGLIYTNGWLLSDNILDQFEQRELRPEFSISFDGLGWHDWMRGINGAQKAVIDALTLCKARNFPYNVEMCVHKGNLSVIRETVNHLAHLGVTRVRIGTVAQTPLWQKNSEGNDMTQQEYAEAMINYIPYFFEDNMPLDLLIGGIIALQQGSIKYDLPAEAHKDDEKCLDCHLCGAARYACYITPEGRLLPCMPMTACKEQEQFARFQDIGLRKGLSDSFYMQFVDKRLKDLLAVNEKCAACAHKYQCAGGCRAAALEQSGNLMGSDLDRCFLWENGYVEKIHRVADEAIAKYCKKEDASNED